MDAVVSKAGYGTLTECIANSVPLIYLPRYGFVEHEALVLGMNALGRRGGDFGSGFLCGRLGRCLASALSARPDPNVYPTNGAEVIAQKLEEYLPMSQPKIIMYTRPGCPDVARAAYYLRQRGLTWDEMDIEARRRREAASHRLDRARSDADALDRRHHAGRAGRR